MRRVFGILLQVAVALAMFPLVIAAAPVVAVAFGIGWALVALGKYGARLSGYDILEFGDDLQRIGRRMQGGESGS